MLTTTEHKILPGDSIRRGDILHDHNDAVVLSVKRDGNIMCASVLRSSGAKVAAFWGANASMEVTRVEPNVLGACVGTMRHGTLVQFFCESLDGGPTDSHVVNIEFPTEAIAAAVAQAATSAD